MTDLTPASTDALNHEAADPVELYLADPAPALPEDYAQLQLAAMAELRRLTPEAVDPARLEVESACRAACRAAETVCASALQKLDGQYHQARAAGAADFDERISAVDGEYASSVNKLKASAREQRDRINSSADNRLAKTRAKSDYDVLTAENIHEGTLLRIEQDRKISAEAADHDAGQLDELASEVQAVHDYYHHLAPAVSEPSAPPVPVADDPPADYAHWHGRAVVAVRSLHDERLPHLLTGLTPWVLGVFVCLVVAGGVFALSWYRPIPLPSWQVAVPVAFGLALGGMIWLYVALRRAARGRLGAIDDEFRRALAGARAALERRRRHDIVVCDRRVQQAAAQLEKERMQARAHVAQVEATVAEGRQSVLAGIETEYEQKRVALEQRYEPLRAQLRQEREAHLEQLRADYQRERDELTTRRDETLALVRSRYQKRRDALEQRWLAGLAVLRALLERTAQLDGHAARLPWSDPAWEQWASTWSYSPFVRFGGFELDFGRIAEGPRQLVDFPLPKEGRWDLPALLAFPQRCSLLLESGRQGREQAVATLRAVVLRLFAALPAGRVRFTLIDPIGLGENFAGFMHAADYEEALVNSRIWTEASHIQQRLADLTDHMENVIQKYLRNEFDTIEEYNAQAGELAEPYRFLVIADFPTSWNEEAIRRLSSILTAGPRCGVYTLIHYDARQPLPQGIHLEDLTAATVHLRGRDGKFVWQHEVAGDFPLVLDRPADEDRLTRLVHCIGAAARESARVEVPFQAICPRVERRWTADAGTGLEVPIGRSGATRLQHLRLGQGMAQHALIAGRTGSGKSNLLHVIITNLALWYAPDEVEFYLVDFKRGVEFKTYVNHKLPHARAIAIESDREFGLSILQRLDGEMARRGEMFRKAGVQDLAGYRRASGKKLPRTVLLVDEFQVFFAEDDKLAQDAALLLEQLVRQGRAFGIHVILGSQTLGGASGLARSTIGQMAVRIALQCAEADAQLILDDTNPAARLLARPGEAIYNDAGGLTVGNSPFQTSWLPESERDVSLAPLAELAAGRAYSGPPAIVFEGNAPAHLPDNHLLADVLAASVPALPPAVPVVWLGEPTAIKEPTAVAFVRQGGAHLLIVGQRDDAAAGLTAASLVSLAAHYGPNQARFLVLDGGGADSPLAGVVPDLAAALPHDVELVGFREVPDAIGRLDEHLAGRLEQHDHPAARDPVTFLIIFGLHRFRMLRRNEDDFSFSLDAEAAKADPGKQLAHLLREGPALGVHVLAWVDTLSSLERTLDRQSVREFDNLVLFQMSAADSSHLIDSPAANLLGFHRALLYSEQLGRTERFRPYALPEPEWLRGVLERLAHR